MKKEKYLSITILLNKMNPHANVAEIVNVNQKKRLNVPAVELAIANNLKLRTKIDMNIKIG